MYVFNSLVCMRFDHASVLYVASYFVRSLLVSLVSFVYMMFVSLCLLISLVRYLCCDVFMSSVLSLVRCFFIYAVRSFGLYFAMSLCISFVR